MLTIKDIMLLLIIGIWLLIALRAIRKAKKAGKCIGCHGDCARCGHQAVDKRAVKKDAPLSTGRETSEKINN